MAIDADFIENDGQVSEPIAIILHPPQVAKNQHCYQNDTIL